MPNQYGRPNQSSKVISVILIIAIVVIGIILFMNKIDKPKYKVLENGTPVCLNTEFSKYKKGLIQYGMCSNENLFNDACLNMENLAKVKYRSQKIITLSEEETKEHKVSEAKVFEFEVNKSYFGKIPQGETIFVICYGSAIETDFSFANCDESILSLVEYKFRNENSYYIMQNEDESVFYVLNQKVYPNLDIYEYADYIGMKENKFIKEVNKIRKNAK